MPQGALYTIGGLSGGSTVKLLKKVIFHPFNPFFGQFSPNREPTPRFLKPRVGFSISVLENGRKIKK
jgi:hypothetical protein